MKDKLQAAIKELEGITEHKGGMDYGNRTVQQIEAFDNAYNMAIRGLKEWIGAYDHMMVKDNYTTDGDVRFHLLKVVGS